MSSVILSIESSCDEAACALFDLKKFEEGESAINCVINASINSQIKLHSEYGGVVPELASREHMRSLPLLVQDLIANSGITLDKISAISVTAGPGLKGCLLVGVSFAKGLGLSLNAPVFPVNHLEGHLLSGFYQSSIYNIKERLPAIALLVSGGHTQLALIDKIGSYKILASTQDDAAGEAFDKIGSLLGLGYPAGYAVSQRAMTGNPIYELPKSMSHDPNSFSFSGLKTAANLFIKKNIPPVELVLERNQFINDFCASLEYRIVETLISKTQTWIEEFDKSATKVNSLIVCGGVAGNARLRLEAEQLATNMKLNLLIPPTNLCADNAVMIALVTAFKLQKNKSISPKPFAVRARWPINEIDNW